MIDPPAVKKHPVGWYRVSLVVLVVGVGYLLLSGRLVASIRAVGSPNMPHDAFFHHFMTNVLWVASIMPFFLTSHWLVTRRRAERSFTSYWDAAKTVFAVAWRGHPLAPEETEPIEEPESDPLMALLKAGTVAVGLPLFFWFSPVRLPHTQKVEIWLAVSGLLMGGTVYCQERARPYLRREWLERNRGRFFARTWTVNPANYEAPGKGWIVAHWVLSVLLGATWLGGSAWAFRR